MGSGERNGEPVRAGAGQGVVAEAIKGSSGTAGPDALGKSLGQIKFLEEQLITAKQDNERLRGELSTLNETIFSKTFQPPSAWADRERKYLLERQQWEGEAALQAKRLKRLQSELRAAKGGDVAEQYQRQIEDLKSQAMTLRLERDAAMHAAHELKIQCMDSTGEFVSEGGEKQYARQEEVPHMVARAMIDKLEGLSGGDKERVQGILNRSLHLDEQGLQQGLGQGQQQGKGGEEEQQQGQGQAQQQGKDGEKAQQHGQGGEEGQQRAAEVAAAEPPRPPRPVATGRQRGGSITDEEVEMLRGQADTLRSQVGELRGMLADRQARDAVREGALESALAAARTGDLSPLEALCGTKATGTDSSAHSGGAAGEGAAVQQGTGGVGGSGPSGAGAASGIAGYSRDFARFVRTISLTKDPALPHSIKEDEEEKGEGELQVEGRQASEWGSEQVEAKVRLLKEERDALRSQLADLKAQVASQVMQKEDEMFETRRKLLASLEANERLQADLTACKAAVAQLERQLPSSPVLHGGASTKSGAARDGAQGPGTVGNGPTQGPGSDSGGSGTGGATEGPAGGGQPAPLPRARTGSSSSLGSATSSRGGGGMQSAGSGLLQGLVEAIKRWEPLEKSLAAPKTTRQRNRQNVKMYKPAYPEGGDSD